MENFFPQPVPHTIPLASTLRDNLDRLADDLCIERLA